ncbi:hypothetical protein JCM16303_004314 [Sporobolomyces ruberrimus]
MTRYFCHECQHEGTDFLVTPSPQCPRCQGSFVEEANDPRDFDPDDGIMGGPGGGGIFPLATLMQGIEPEGGGGFFDPERGVGFTFAIGPGGTLVGAGRTGPGRGGQGLEGDFGQTLFRVLGLAPPAQGGEERERGNAGVTIQDPDEEELPRAEGDREGQEDGRNQVPIQNLAAFLGEAFGDPRPHPADDPSNNPFAEGGVDAPPTGSNERRAQSEPGGGGANAEPGQGGARGPGGGGNGNPLNYLFSLMNSFGINGQMLGGNGFANAGDYVWGGEANFQNLLNDLMEQASRPPPPSLLRLTRPKTAGPVPATEEMIEKLPRVEVTEELLGHDTIKDCTICQDDFVLSETLASLPCRHLFHPDCIVPWLKTSGTCPVCRYALIPQPGQEGYVEPPRPGLVNPLNPQRGGGGDEANTSGERQGRPSQTRQSSTSSIPSTARIPSVDNGSRLPGSWTFGGSRGARAGEDSMDIDEDDEWTDAENDEGVGQDEADKSPEARAAEAAERRLEMERRGEREDSQPVIEDVD